MSDIVGRIPASHGGLSLLPGAAVAASHLYITIGLLPETTMEDTIVVRGVRTPGTRIDLEVNGSLEASGTPEGNLYRVRVSLSKGPNRIVVTATTPNHGEQVSKTAHVFRTSVSFADMGLHWGKAHAEILASLGVVNGIGGGNFGPDLQVTRAQFAKMVALAMNLDVEESGQIPFADGASIPAWARPYVAAAARHELISGYEENTFRADQQITRAGILSGYEDGRFAPDRTATRAEAAAMVHRLWTAQR